MTTHTLVPTRKKVKYIVHAVVIIEPSYPGNLDDLNEVLESIRGLGTAEVVDIEIIEPD